MMYQKKKFPFRHIQDLKCRVLELPYQGKELSMIILLPDDIEDESTGLRKVTKGAVLVSCLPVIYRLCLICRASSRCIGAGCVLSNIT